ncbi:MAG: PEP-CTERM sorting domain-containing protein [Colwellia sp.]|nr:PEP-CTERM sorting domain-containing protein [Colwellia sp.]MCW9081243.1 PEP-CTERM sorting domain-containing protein [Colwellia sp.]
MRLIKYLPLSLAMITSVNTFASLIDYELDLETGYIINTNQQLEYLQFNATNGMTAQEALNTFSVDGWSVATDEQGANFIVDATSYPYYDRIIAKNSISGYASDSQTDPLGDLFGYTYYAGAGSNINGWIISDGTDEERVSFKFGDIDNYYSLFNLQGRYSEYNIASPSYTYNRSGSIGINYNYARSDDDYGSYGAVLMVRSIEVPEPSTFAIFALGLIGLASRRFKKQS